MLAELVPKLLDIAKTQYGHFAVLKAVTYCDHEDNKQAISKALAGHFVSLGKVTVIIIIIIDVIIITIIKIIIIIITIIIIILYW